MKHGTCEETPLFANESTHLNVSIDIAIDTAKTVLQIDSTEGFRSLMRRVRAGKIGVLYSGAIANAVSAILGHYPWVRQTGCCKQK